MNLNKALISEYETRLAQADALLKEKLKRVQDVNPALKEKEKDLKAIEDQITKKSAQLSEVEKPPEKMFSVLFTDSSAGIFPEAELQPVESIPKEQFDMLTSLLSGDSEDDVDDTDDLPGIKKVELTDGKPEQDAEGYIKSPSEDKKWLGMIQFDSRKKNVGIDFRWQVSDSTIAAFTVFVPKGLTRIPENPADAKKILTKEILPLVKENIADPLKKFNCQPKDNISATKDVFKEMIGYGPGYEGKRYMWTIENFTVEHGSKKPHYVELFCQNDFINGRIIFVKIPNKTEWKRTPEGDYTWMMFKTKSPTPYVLSTRAVDKKWISPYGASALPRRIRDKIPRQYQYWKKKDEKMRLKLRDQLVEEIKKKLLLKLDERRKEKTKV